jgi:acetyl-CoA acetyltransferase
MAEYAAAAPPGGPVTFRDRVCIAGVGYTEFSRHSGRSDLQLAFEACRNALHDAGLEPAAIDGIGSSFFAGKEAASPFEVGQLLGIPEFRWFGHQTGRTPTAINNIIHGSMAVATGLCHTALVYRSVLRVHTQSQAPRPTAPPRATGDAQFLAPYYGGPGITGWAAFWTRRHMHAYGTRPEHLGWVAINARRHAALNERAVYRQPFDLGGYLASRMVCDPLRLLDCDLPVDGAIALVLTTPERARDLRQVPVRVAGARYSAASTQDWLLAPDLTRLVGPHVASDLWEQAGLRPEDVDVAELYDGYSWFTIGWLEALGFVKPGEGGPFVEGGRRIDLEGELPITTHGGQLSEGRVHGAGYVAEAVLQLRGACGPRQVKDAEVAVATNGGGSVGSMMVLTR